jgi:C1A family cysteine protease
LKEEERLEALSNTSQSTKPIVTAKNPFKVGTLFYKMFALGTAYLDVDWRARGKVTPVRDQGSCGSCWAFSSIAALEAAFKVDSNRDTNLSEQELVSCSPWDCDGGWMTEAFQYVKVNGVHTEANFPYTSTNGTCTASSITQPKENFHEVINMVSGNMYAFLTKLAVKPVTVAFTAQGAFMTYKTGILDANKICTGTEYVNHAVVAVGYKIDTVYPARSYILFKNSWGTTWGDAGYFKFKLYNTISTQGPCGLLKYGEENYYVNTITPA